LKDGSELVGDTVGIPLGATDGEPLGVLVGSEFDGRDVGFDIEGDSEGS